MLADLHPDPKMLSLEMDVKMTVREATLTVTPKFFGKNSPLVTLEMVRRNFTDKPEVALQTALAAFDRRVRVCLGQDFGKAATPQGAAMIKNWLAGPLATAQSMGMTLPGHETVAASFDSYVKERHAEDPKKPADGAAWLEAVRNAKDPGTWNKQFSEPLGRWANWFKPKFEQQWQEYAKVFAGALKTTPQVRIEAITSLAYDEAGKEYRVPLTVFGGEIPAAGFDAKVAGDADQKSPQPGDTVPSPTGGGIRAGID